MSLFGLPTDESQIKVKNTIIKFSNTPQDAFAEDNDALNIKLTYCEKNPALALISYKVSDTDIKDACFQSLSNPTFTESQIIISSIVLKISYTQKEAQNDDLVLDPESTTTTTPRRNTNLIKNKICKST